VIGKHRFKSTAVGFKREFTQKQKPHFAHQRFLGEPLEPFPPSLVVGARLNDGLLHWPV